MRILLAVVIATGGLVAAGCGGDPKPAGKPTDDMIRADKAEQKKVEDEERGNVTPKKK